MKVMAGYDHEKLPDYKKMFEDELDKIRSNSLVLSGILDAKKPGDRFDRDPHLHELHGQVKSAQSRIQKMITEADDESRVGFIY